MALQVPAVIPIPGPNSTTAGAGVPVIALGANINGGWISNPQGAPGILFVDPTGNVPSLAVGGSTFPIYPGDTYLAIPGQTTVTQVRAADPNHTFSSVQW